MFNRKTIKYFFIISCIVSVLYPLINIYLIFPSFSRLLLKNTENDTIRIARNLSSIVVSEKNKFKNPEEFIPGIKKIKEEFNIQKIKLFSGEGKVIYSTDPKDIGTVNNKKYFHEIVAGGMPYSKVVQKDSRSLEDQKMTIDVVETYVPIFRNSRFLGAFEIYYDITGRSQALHKNVVHSSIISFVLMFSYFIAILLVLSRKDYGESELSSGKKPANYQSASYLLLVMIISIFIAETITMLILSKFPSIPESLEAVTDAVILVMMVSPILYFVLFRPLISHINRRKHAEEELKKAQDILVESNRNLKQEINERKDVQRQMYQSKKDWEDTFNIITDMITVHDSDYNIIRANRAADKILGLPIIENDNPKCFHYYHGTDSPPQGCPSCDCLKTGKPAVFELFEPHLNRFIEIRAIPRFDSNDKLIGLIHVVRDITQRREMEDKLKALSLTDELTGLHNRRGFFTLVQQQLKMSKRQNRRAFLLYADADDFKKINDKLGHSTGDSALVDIADILRSTYRESDIIARIGGDEFIVYAEQSSKENAGEILARLQGSIDEFNAGERRGYVLSISAGVVIHDPGSPCSVDELLSRADELMYTRKKEKQKV